MQTQRTFGTRKQKHRLQCILLMLIFSFFSRLDAREMRVFPLDSTSPRILTPLELGLQQPLRAGFYVNWDERSFQSLHDHVDKLNMVLPEWLQVTDADTVSTMIDQTALDFLKEHPSVKIVPMVTNFFKGAWNGANVQRIIRSPERRKVFIASVLNILNKHHFKGINIDFENLNVGKSDTYLTIFQQELYFVLHTEGYIVSQDVNALNEDYDLTELAKVNDLLFVMAYDLHYEGSDAGDVAPKKWVEGIIETVSTKAAREKLVLCFAGYGYNWGAKGTSAKSVTYKEAMAIAEKSNAKINASSESQNVNFSYKDDKNVLHHVHFMDATSNFYNIRMADSATWGGVALWRLGSEDPDLWRFYDKNLLNEPLPNAAFESPKGTILPVYTEGGVVLKNKTVAVVGKPKIIVTKVAAAKTRGFVVVPPKPMPPVLPTQVSTEKATEKRAIALNEGQKTPNNFLLEVMGLLALGSFVWFFLRRKKNSN